jgi:transposase InsO family protein
MDKIESADVADTLLRLVFAYHDLPRAIVSDRGPQFVSLFWAEICKRLGITRRLSTAFHPQTDGATERANQEVETYLRLFTTFQQDDWARLLPGAMIALNNRTSASTGFSPFFLTHGFHGSILSPATPDASEKGSDISPAEKGRAWLRKWKELSDFAQAAIADAQETQERHANRSRQASDLYRIGDKVFFRLRNIRTLRLSKKLN